MHTICQLCDFGYQTAQWMDDLKDMLRKAGVTSSIPYNGQPLPHLRDASLDTCNGRKSILSDGTLTQDMATACPASAARRNTNSHESIAASSVRTG